MHRPHRPGQLWWSCPPPEVQIAEQLCILIRHLFLQIFQTLLLHRWMNNKLIKKNIFPQCWELNCPCTWGLHSSSSVVPVPVLQPTEQLIGTALLSLLTNHSLQRPRAVLVDPEQSHFPPWLSRSRCIRGWRRRVWGGEAQIPANSLSWPPSRWRSSLSCPGYVALGQAGLWRAGGVGRCGITFRRRDLLGCRGAFEGFAGSSGLWGFDLNTNKIINAVREKKTQ